MMWSKSKELLRNTVRSMKVRIFLLFLCVGIIPGIVMRHGIISNYEDRAVSVRTSDVQTQLKIIANHLITYNHLQGAPSDVINAELEQLSNLYDGRVIIINSNFKVVKDTYGISEGKYVISEEVIRCFKGESISNYDSNNGYIEITTPIQVQAQQDGDTPNVIGVMLTSVSSDTVIQTVDSLNRNAIIMEIMIIVIVFLLAVFLAKILTAPINRVTQAIGEVKAGYTDKPIEVNDYLETEHIVDAFNDLMGRMQVLDDSRQEFVANVSHELKTPIASMKVLADSLLAQNDVPAELYREFLEDIAAEIDRENKIITDLLALVKMDKTVSDMNISVVNINDLTELILKRLRPIARKQDVEVVFESHRVVEAEVDEVKLTLVITNLVENAIKYNRKQGWVKVILDADHQFFTMEICDSGIGIPEDSLDHIYERFYRVDKSHSREIGGTGLGLAITRSAILMHRGSIRVSSVMGEGTTFSIKIPLTYVVS